VIVGQPEIVGRCAKNPLARALRPDKLTLAALAATFRGFLSADPRAAVPALRLLELTAAEIEPAANRLAERLRAAVAAAQVEVRPGASRVGGGAAPEEDLPTWLVAVRLGGVSEDALLERLRRADPPVVARTQDGAVLFDPRTLLPGEEDMVVAAVAAAR
jgi:L-seryl-tRNA(Ser) seleniumtransferase